MAQKSLCVHGHFYQPSREDPISGVIPLEEGADPYNNWNEKINADCYAPNAELGNFGKMSFNLGPTLVNWMKSAAPGTLDRIAGDEKAYSSVLGVGNGLAQPFHHTILPLATRLDKITQVRWGIESFRQTFGHEPEGMWLPETAVDLETLQVLAENGIRYTILAPWQADKEDLDITHPYRVELAEQKEITVFFYHQGLSTCISFDPCSTQNADTFVHQQLKGKFSTRDEDQFLLIASDGELYGHHQPFRDKFLGYLLDGALHSANMDFSTPGRWLRDHPAVEKIGIRERTSWSCAHGVNRWSEECGCTPNGHWKQVMREFLNLVTEKVDEDYLAQTTSLLSDPWEARHAYIKVILGLQGFSDWEHEQLLGTIHGDQSLLLQMLMRAQYERQRMFTSCGWFFDDFDRIEPRNNILYAAHAVALTEQASNRSITGDLIPLLDELKSWKSSLRGRDVFFDALRRFRQQTLS